MSIVSRFGGKSVGASLLASFEADLWQTKTTRALRWVCLGVFVVRNFDKELEVESVMYEFTLLMILINSLHVEMHSNHTYWIVPTTVIVLTHYRYRSWYLYMGALDRIDASR
jgi:hypothetical protein